MNTLGYLKITSYTWIGSIGAEHFYGKIYIEKPDEQIDLQHKMSAKMAKYMNKKEGTQDFCRYKPNEMTNKFDTEEEITLFGLHYFKARFPKGILIKGDQCVRSAMYPIIYVPKELLSWSDKINKLVKEWNDIDGYEGGKAKRAEQIDIEWYKLIKPHLS